MEERKKKRLERAGFRVGNAADFLDLTAAQREAVALRLALARAVRARRERRGWTQQQLATAIASSQSRVAKVETAAPGISLDLMFRAYFAVGGTLAALAGGAP